MLLLRAGFLQTFNWTEMLHVLPFPLDTDCKVLDNWKMFVPMSHTVMLTLLQSDMSGIARFLHLEINHHRERNFDVCTYISMAKHFKIIFIRTHQSCHSTFRILFTFHNVSKLECVAFGCLLVCWCAFLFFFFFFFLVY